MLNCPDCVCCFVSKNISPGHKHILFSWASQVVRKLMSACALRWIPAIRSVVVAQRMGPLPALACSSGIVVEAMRRRALGSHSEVDHSKGSIPQVQPFRAAQHWITMPSDTGVALSTLSYNGHTFQYFSLSVQSERWCKCCAKANCDLILSALGFTQLPFPHTAVEMSSLEFC